MADRFKAILFDLDGTLLDSNMGTFLPQYFSRLAARVAHIAPPKTFIAHLLEATEAKLIIATVAQRCRLTPVPGHPIAVEPGVTLRPKHGLLMRVEMRDVASQA